MSLVMTGPKLQFIGPGRGDQVGYGSGSSKGFAEGAEDSGDPGGSADSEGTEGSEVGKQPNQKMRFRYDFGYLTQITVP